MDELRAHPTWRGLGASAACLILAARVAALPGGVGLRSTPPPAAASRAVDLAPRDVRHAVTGRDGRTRLQALPPGPWRVTVHARGFIARSVLGVSSGPLVVTLERGGVVTGTVVSFPDRRPIAGARVALAPDGPLPTAWPEDGTRNVAVSDARGTFRLEGVGPSPQALRARAPGLAIGERRDVRAGDRVEIVLFPGSTLRGAVRDEDGRPVRGALVRAEADRFWGEEPPPQRTAISGHLLDAGPAVGQVVVAIGADGFERAETRADGSFRLEGLTDRPYALSAGSSLAGFATRRGVRPGPEAVALALQPAGRVAASVRCPDGRRRGEHRQLEAHLRAQAESTGGRGTRDADGRRSLDISYVMSYVIS